jgi:hypothetical protein
MSGRIKIKMERPDSDTVYVALPGYPDPIKPGVVRKSVSLDDIFEYRGPRVQLDFDEDGILIGVEIVA